MSKLTIPLVTSWDTPCGIAEHSTYLKAAVEAADAEMRLAPDARFLDPLFALQPNQLVAPSRLLSAYPIVHINHHDGLHSRWRTEHVAELQAAGIKVVCTWHDTREGTAASPNSPKAKEWGALCDAFIVHEPVADISGPRVHYWRQGVPALQDLADYDYGPANRFGGRAYAGQPTIGSIGFAFPWKGFELLCEAAHVAGWAVFLIAHNATDDQCAEWQRLNPRTSIIREFVPAAAAVTLLHQWCTATAFLYSCANTGTSGAIRQGIAARRPVLANPACRQMRDLYEDARAGQMIQWVSDMTVDGVATALAHLQPRTHQVCRLAEEESWATVGVKYSRLYRELLA